MPKGVSLSGFQVLLTLKAMLGFLEVWAYSVEPRVPTDRLQGLTSAGRQGAFLVLGDLQCQEVPTDRDKL